MGTAFSVLILGWTEEDWLQAVEWFVEEEPLPDSAALEAGLEIKGKWAESYGELLPSDSRLVWGRRKWDCRRTALAFVKRLKASASTMCCGA